MDQNRNTNVFKRFRHKTALLAALLFSSKDFGPQMGLDTAFVQSYRDSGSSRFQFTVKPWMRKGKRYGSNNRGKR